jgi:TIR domain
MSSEDRDELRKKIRKFYGMPEPQASSDMPIPIGSIPQTDRDPTKQTSIPDDTSTAGKRVIHVFLCHAAEDKTAVRSLYHRLKQDGFRPWLDEEELFPGQDWEYEVTKAVRASDVILVCISRRSTTKTGFVQRELRFALDLADERPEGTIFIIPCRLEECPIPTRLKVWHWVNLFEQMGYSRLTRSLELLSRQLEEGQSDAEA